MVFSGCGHLEQTSIIWILYGTVPPTPDPSDRLIRQKYSFRRVHFPSEHDVVCEAAGMRTSSSKAMVLSERDGLSPSGWDLFLRA